MSPSVGNRSGAASITWTKGWEDVVKEAALAHMWDAARATAEEANQNLRANWRIPIKAIAAVNEKDTESVAIGFQRRRFYWAFTETGNQYYAPRPSILPAARNHFT